MNKYIGITENRMYHIIGVARKCYKIAKDMDMPEEFCKKMFVIGYLHDIGYEFCEKQEEHPAMSEEMLKLIGVDNKTKESQKVLHTIRKHGLNTKTKSLEWKILNMADMTINSKGDEVTANERLSDIKKGMENISSILKCYGYMQANWFN